MIAAIVRTHRIREAMSERFHWFGWKEREDGLFVFTVIVYRGQEVLIYVIIRLTTLWRPVRGGLNIDNDVRICFRLSINGFSLNLADKIFTQLEAKLEDLSLNGFIYIYISILYLYSYRPDCRRIFSDWKIFGAKMFYCNALGQSCPVNTSWSSTHVGF